MRKLHIITFLATLVCCTFSFSQNSPTNYSSGIKIYSGLLTGYNGGFGIQGNVTMSILQQALPVSVRLGIGYTSLNPGKPDAARRIFINNATNGTPEESGWIWDFRVDVLLPFRLISNSFVYFGPRYSMFTGNFKYVGGNEDFDVTADQFGLGGGIETHIPVVQNLSMVLSGGLGYYFESSLKGHDTEYGPDGENVNPREDYSYSEADDAINQPKIVGRFMFGINYSF